MRTKHARQIPARPLWERNPAGATALAALIAAHGKQVDESTEGVAVSLGGPRTSRSAQARADAAEGVTLIDPPRMPTGTPLVGVRMDGVEARVPLGWGIALSSARGRDALYLREPSGILHVLVVNADGEVRELAGVPADLVADLLAQHFPGAGR